ncbi:peptidoglycan-binding protein [Streptomyces pactum]|uniref:peptidoglycan-binding protein n=1 Tax=Streptomyces pactum TaxID=68249 RepID=UPI0027DCCD0E|nr:peptidoglycan-binding protein [Streptomyces pactum]
MKRRTALVTLTAVTAAAAATAAALVLDDGGRDPGGTAREGLPPATTAIERMDLVRSTTVDGHVDHAGRRTVKTAVEGTVTRAAREGGTVGMGGVLYELDARPVVLLYGSTPMFRPLKPGALGPDVLQLERNLRDLGHGSGLVIDHRYDAATKAAVKSWQRALGVLGPTGELGRGDVVFQPGPVRVVAADAALADQVAPGAPVLTVASPTPVVRVELQAEDRALGRKGTRAEITLPAGRTVGGKVTGTVRPVPGAGGEAAGAADPNGGLTVEIALDDGADAVRGDDQGTASVRFVSERRENVLTVPVEAVVALREGGYGLETVRGDRTRTVRVETGMTADGRIEVTGDGLTEGMKVGVAKP